MKIDGYKKLFNAYLDSNIFNQLVLLSPKSLSNDNKLSILDDLAFRLQIEFQKSVVLITNKRHNCEIEVFDNTQPTAELPLIYNKSRDIVFLVDIDSPYFDDKMSWEDKIVELLIYYKYPAFGFMSGCQRIKLYEEGALL
jgi:hypothetical protein